MVLKKTGGEMITFRRFSISILILWFVMLACMYWIYFDRQAELNHKQHEVNILWAYKLNEPALREQIANLEADKALLQQDVSFYKGKFESDELYIDVLESDYLMAISYITVAELIIERNCPTPFIYTGRR